MKMKSYEEKSKAVKMTVCVLTILLAVVLAAGLLPQSAYASATKSTGAAKKITVYAGGKLVKRSGYWVKDARNSKKRVAMVPLGQTAANLGLKVRKSGKSKKDVTVTGAPMYMQFRIGEDGYSFTTSNPNLCGATGLIRYGAAAAVRGGRIYVPARVYTGVYMQDSAVKVKRNTVVITAVK